MADKCDADDRRLSDIFDEGLELFNELSKSSEPTNSSSVQGKVHKSMHLLEDATRLVSLAGMFSSNETEEEIPTSNIKFLLLPALLGTLSLKVCSDDRMQIVETAEVYFRDYLQRCKDYGITDVEIPQPSTNDSDMPSALGRETDLIAMARDRNAKLQRYKEQKMLESQLEELRKNMDSCMNTDEEIKRKFFLTMIKSYVNQALDELSSIEMEKPLIEHMKKVRKDPKLAHEHLDSVVKSRKPLKPIIITKDEMQKKVFGAGYPSLPTMTVQEFYDQKVRQGDFPDPNAPQQAQTLQDKARMGIQEDKEKEAEELERKIEDDDPEMLRQKRNFDEFKDDHRRGFGNRMNRS
ncbi:immunoglobulin-binding protein 1 [Anabrus simplex]|uniref:immunoglobulin-binding protein 1 n=1 Tax=Anabrus simplex TaxID=316456 RepID=UPI0034DD032F